MAARAGWVTLVVPPGIVGYPISHDGDQYTPYREDHTDENSGWLVDVPAAVGGDLARNGGFAMVTENVATAEAPRTVKLRHPEGVGCNWNGDAYDADDDGLVTVPAAAVADLAAHGFAAPGAVAAQGLRPLVDREADLVELTDALAQAKADLVAANSELGELRDRLAVAETERDAAVAELDKATAPAGETKAKK